MSRRVVIIAILFVSLLGAYAVDIPYVDVEVAAAKVTQLEEQNTALAADSEQKKADNIEKEKEIDELIAKVNDMDPILQKVEKKSKDLTSVYL